MINDFNAVGRIVKQASVRQLNRTTRNGKPRGVADFKIAVQRSEKRNGNYVADFVPIAYYGTWRQVVAFRDNLVKGTLIWVQNAHYVSKGGYDKNHIYHNNSAFYINNNHDYGIISRPRKYRNNYNNASYNSNNYNNANYNNSNQQTNNARPMTNTNGNQAPVQNANANQNASVQQAGNPFAKPNTNTNANANQNANGGKQLNISDDNLPF